MKIVFEKKKKPKSDVFVVFAGEGGILGAVGKSLDRDTKGAIARALRAEGFQGKKSQIMSLSGVEGAAARHILVAGIGKETDITPADFEKIGSALLPALNGKKAKTATVLFDMPLKAESASRLGLGLLLNSYRFDKYLTKEPEDKKPSLKSVVIVTAGATAAQKLFAKEKKLAEAVFLTRDLVSEVPNVLYPESYAAIIKKQLSPLGVKVTVMGMKEMKKMGMGALIAVGQGSVREPKLVTMEYRGGKKAQKNIALVGKGVTFDTGGISLKPGAGMEDMKWDMAGSAAVVGAMRALAARKAKANVIGVVALAENMPSGNASRPSDIVKTMSGQTVEILNTDAEGRLILCDALWYVQKKFQPTHIVDLATLTGAIIIALGHEFGGVFANDDKLADSLIAAGKAVDENLWHMPLHDAWDKEINSPAADIKNIGAGRGAGSAIGAHFLKRFIQKGVSWAHLDIAGVAWSSKDRPTVPKGASAFGVRLLDQYVATHEKK